ncbi:uncharacterized protein LOC132726379 [Ruditapes philippinarum]|uniref:uncharacterized protein LOC132726379 n=1 Tax=Ruditapes philippinarum TaxID=129788 RepID=UPI00295A74D3|nr:uncharacterized protein LOC132726379 [Ruditapes philippinarum]
MIQIIELGIKNKKEMLVMKGLDKVLTYVDDMVKKTKDTIQEYYNIKTAVNDEISNIDQKNKDIKTRKSEISSEMQQKRLKLESERKDVTNLDAKNKEKEKELQKLKSKRLKLIGDSVQTYGLMDSFKELFTAGIATIGGCIGGAETGKMVFDGVRTATTTRKDQASQQALNASAETKRDIDEEQQRIEENERRVARMREEAIEGLAAMERLALENADLMNEENLKMAGTELGKVAQLFGKILLFWEDFSAKLTALKNTHDGVKLFIEFVNDPDLAEDIDDSVLQVKKVWNSFGIMCTYYVDESVKQLPELYAFMGAPVDQSSVKECDERKKALLAAHRADIRALEKKII